MDVVENHELEILNLLFLKTLLIQVSSADLSAHDLASHEVSSLKNKLHLIEDEVNFLHGL